MIRGFTMNDYDSVYQLWKDTPGVGLRSMDDSREGIERFLKRNPTTNFVADEEGKIVGTAFGGHDGRRGYLYHVCVSEEVRRRSVGRQLIEQMIEAMKAENITRLALFCLSDNESGNRFWSRMGWSRHSGLNTYAFSIEEDNGCC